MPESITVAISHAQVPEVTLEAVGPARSRSKLPIKSGMYECEDFIDSLKSVHSIQEILSQDSVRLPYPERRLGRFDYLPVRYFNYRKESDYDLPEYFLKDIHGM